MIVVCTGSGNMKGLALKTLGLGRSKLSMRSESACCECDMRCMTCVTWLKRAWRPRVSSSLCDSGSARSTSVKRLQCRERRSVRAWYSSITSAISATGGYSRVGAAGGGGGRAVPDAAVAAEASVAALGAVRDVGEPLSDPGALCDGCCGGGAIIPMGVSSTSKLNARRVEHEYREIIGTCIHGHGHKMESTVYSLTPQLNERTRDCRFPYPKKRKSAIRKP